MPPRQPAYCVAYYRVSTDEQGKSGLGMEAQRSAVHALAKSRGWRIIAEHEDIASGKSDNRPGFQAALAECRRMGAILCAARFDRISRNAHTVSGLLQEGIRLRPADMPDADDMMVRIHAAVAQRERELISERTKAALKAAKDRGVQLGGDRGYRPTTVPNAALAAAAVIAKADRDAARVLPVIEELRAAGATSLHQLAAGLNAQGITTPRGSDWTATAVRRALARQAA